MSFSRACGLMAPPTPPFRPPLRRGPRGSDRRVSLLPVCVKGSRVLNFPSPRRPPRRPPVYPTVLNLGTNTSPSHPQPTKGGGRNFSPIPFIYGLAASAVGHRLFLWGFLLFFTYVRFFLLCRSLTSCPSPFRVFPRLPPEDFESDNA